MKRDVSAYISDKNRTNNRFKMAIEALIGKKRYLYLGAMRVSNNHNNLFYEYTEKIAFYLNYRIEYRCI